MFTKAGMAWGGTRIVAPIVRPLSNETTIFSSDGGVIVSRVP